jgi:hypothetical protein
MFNVIHRRVAAAASWIYRHRYHCGITLSRWKRAWRYASGRLSADDAQRLLLDCRYPAGWHPLLVLTVEDTLEQARQEIADHPDLARLVADGCARVGDKWEPYYVELLEARCWAINLAKNYAVDEGITFVPLNDGQDLTSDRPVRDSTLNGSGAARRIHFLWLGSRGRGGPGRA